MKVLGIAMAILMVIAMFFVVGCSSGKETNLATNNSPSPNSSATATTGAQGSSSSATSQTSNGSSSSSSTSTTQTNGNGNSTENPAQARYNIDLGISTWQEEGSTVVELTIKNLSGTYNWLGSVSFNLVPPTNGSSRQIQTMAVVENEIVSRSRFIPLANNLTSRSGILYHIYNGVRTSEEIYNPSTLDDYALNLRPGETVEIHVYYR